MRPEIQIASMIKAMMDVVIPAIDPGNKLALEQSQLVLGMLSLMAKQLPVQFRFDRDELQRLVASADALKSTQVVDASLRSILSELAACSAHAGEILEQSKRDPAEIVASVHALREVMGRVVTSAAANDPAAQSRIDRIILEMSREQLLRDRSLLLPQGWEPNPAAVPNIETLLGLQTTS